MPSRPLWRGFKTMTATIIDFKTAKTVRQSGGGPPENRSVLKQEVILDLTPNEEEHRKNILDRLDQLRHLVEQGRIEGLILVASDMLTGRYLTETCLPTDMDRGDAFGLIGVLETLKVELTETAAMAPFMRLNGTMHDPFEQQDFQ